MRNKLALSALALWLITIGVLGLMFVRGNRTENIGHDARIVVDLKPAEREYVLTQMRDFLRALHEIQAAFVTGDRPPAEKAARGVGMTNHGLVIENAQPALMLKIPLPMKKIWYDTQRSFDKLADLLATNASTTNIHQELVHLTSKCISCHSGYRLGR